MSCPAMGVIGLPPVSITLDEPLPDGSLVVDGFDPNRDADRGCRELGPGQRVGDPAPPTTYPFC